MSNQPYHSDQVYISGCLTGVDDVEKFKRFYEQIGVLCASRGLKPYIPHLRTDPKKNPDIHATVVFEVDWLEVHSSCLVVAYVGRASTGGGMELQMALNSFVPIIVLYEYDLPISRLPRGTRAVKAHVRFGNFEDALAKVGPALDAVLERWVRCEPLFY